MSINLGKIKPDKSYKSYIVLFLVISILLVIGVSYISFSKVKVTVFPKKDFTHLDFSMSLAPDSINTSSTIKGQIIEREIEISETYTDVEKKEVDAYAKGVVTMQNKRDQAQAFIPRTQLQTSQGLIFRIDDWINIPARGQLDVKVTADQKGEKYNIGPSKFTVVKIWSGLNDVLYGENKEKMAGGKVTDFVVTAKTLKNAEEKGIEAIKEKSLNDFKNSLGKNESLDKNVLEIEVLRYTPKAKEDEITDSFKYQVKAKVTVIAFDKEHIKETGLSKGKVQIQGKKEIIKLPDENITYELKSVDPESKLAVVTVKVKIETMNNIPKKALEKSSLPGMKHGNLVAFYKQFEEIDHIDVFFSPFWVTSVPGNEGNIEIIIE